MRCSQGKKTRTTYSLLNCCGLIFVAPSLRPLICCRSFSAVCPLAFDEIIPPHHTYHPCTTRVRKRKRKLFFFFSFRKRVYLSAGDFEVLRASSPAANRNLHSHGTNSKDTLVTVDGWVFTAR